MGQPWDKDDGRTASITAAAERNFVRNRRVAIMDLLPSEDPVRYGG
jgi:hypothetical protein